MGGATCAAGLAPSGARILILERGARLVDSRRSARRPRDLSTRRVPSARDVARRRRAAVQSRQLLLRRRQHEALRRGACCVIARRISSPSPTRRHDAGLAVCLRRTRALVHPRREAVRVHGALGYDQTEPRAFGALPFPAGAGRAGDRAGAGEAEGRRAASLSLAARRRHRPVARRAQRRPGTPSRTRAPARWTRKLWACGSACAIPNVELRENAKVERLLLAPDGKRLAGVEATIRASARRSRPKTVILSAGAVNSAALLLASRDEAASPTAPTRSAGIS